MSNWRKFRQLNKSERWIFCQALWLMPVAAVALRLLGLRLSRNFFAWFPAQKVSPVRADHSLRQAKRTAGLVQAAAYHGIHRASCLPRSLVLWSLLRRAGIAAEVRIGVRKEDRELRAHAWVECAGIILNDSAGIADEFPPFAAGLVAEEVAADYQG